MDLRLTMPFGMKEPLLLWGAKQSVINSLKPVLVDEGNLTTKHHQVVFVEYKDDVVLFVNERDEGSTKEECPVVVGHVKSEREKIQEILKEAYSRLLV